MHRQLVPRQFWRRTGLETYQFRVVEPWPLPYNYVLTQRGCAERVPPSVLCTHVGERGTRTILLSVRDYPVLCEAMLLVGDLVMGKRTRFERYLTLYKAYEAIVDKPDRRLSSLRHALAHPMSTLTSATTVQSLHELFGGRVINLYHPQHRRIYYLQFATLLMAVDRRLARLLEFATRAKVLPSRGIALHDWQVHARSGSSGTIPICEA